ncbi:MAG: hypothetical protein IJP65_01065 [Bacteroidales bacterium]|nr:hypothetical protein [Bacteroidales bacterium]
MCTVTLNINEAQLRALNPELTDMTSINRWVQQQVDNLIAGLTAELCRSKEQLKPYTMEELNARIDKAERDSAEGRYRDFDDFMRELEEKFAEEDRKELAMMEAV